MSDHLPECPVPEMEAAFGPLHPEDAEANCFCAELRACERRVWKDADRVVNETYRAALDAAREAVTRTCGHTKHQGGRSCAHDDALAAIDALREEKQ